AASSNYAVTYASANLAVTQRAITITADTLSRTYGDANPALTWQVTSGSLVNNDSLSGSLATSATGTSNVGNYAVTQGTLAASSNYAVTFAGANLAVTQRAITVTADTLSRVYGDANPALTWQVTSGSLVNNDSLTGSLTTSAAGTSNVGSYAITQGTLAASSNYAVTYASANLSVTQRAITVTADALSRIYGDANPALTWQVTSGSLVNNDSLSGSLATSATGTSNVGSYAITQGTLAASSNYAVTYASANLAVTQRAITVTADTLSRVYGDANPALTWQVTSGALVNNDSLSGSLATSATGASNVGSYAVTQGTLAASANYAVTYASANLAVTQRAITITADAKSRIYGDANPALTWQVTSGALVNNDSLSGSLATSATGTSNVGSYAVTQGTLAASSNYAVTYANANLTVMPRQVIVTALDASRNFGQPDPALAYLISGQGLVNGDQITGALAREAGESVGSYAILQGSLALSANYLMSYQPGRFTIGALPPSIPIGQLASLTAPAPAMAGAGGAAVLDGLMENAAAITCRRQPPGDLTCP
ncbi:MAG: filamentous hemagglutinin, partial [Rhizobiales bacterium]|nr:filamentous hemagglutinin [Hyphomicrobiales bacterium]